MPRGPAGRKAGEFYKFLQEFDPGFASFCQKSEAVLQKIRVRRAPFRPAA
jgi:hypothetical protein